MAKDGYGEIELLSHVVYLHDPENEEQRHNINTSVLVLAWQKALLTGLNGGLRRCS